MSAALIAAQSVALKSLPAVAVGTNATAIEDGVVVTVDFVYVNWSMPTKAS